MLHGAAHQGSGDVRSIFDHQRPRRLAIARVGAPVLAQRSESFAQEFNAKKRRCCFNAANDEFSGAAEPKSVEGFAVVVRKIDRNSIL